MSERIYRFDKFELNTVDGELRANGSQVRLQEKPLLLLSALLENPQQMVSREELRKRMWPSGTFVDFEQGINVAIKKVRDSLGDSAENPRFIQTVAKKGYRFLVVVEVEGPQATAPAISPAATVETQSLAQNAGHGSLYSAHRRWIFAMITAITAGLLSALGIWMVAVRPQHRTVAQIHSLAVLPLQNLSPDPGQDYFADGITEDLITNLAQSLPLRVISRTSVMRYKQTSEPVTQIAKELGVEAIIEGAVARSGNRVTVTVQLINAVEDRHLWARKYDRQIGDLLGIETEVSQQIASQVGGTLGVRQELKAARSHPLDAQVYDLFLKGRYFWNKRTAEGMMKAAAYFQQAVDLDPNYAPAYVGLADCYLFGQPQTVSPKVLATKVKEMAKKALEIDDSLGEAHATLGLLAQNHEWDWAGAEREYKRAIELNPNYATAHQWYGEHLALMGRFDEGLEELKLASNLDPLSLVIIKDTGEIYYVARKYDRARAYFRKALEMDPNFVIARVNLGMVYAQQREFSSAIAELQKARQLQDGQGLSELGYVYALSAKTHEAQQVLSALRVRSERRYVFPDEYAAIYAGLGDKDSAFEWLEKSYRERGLLAGLKVDPRWDNLRSDARFTDLLKRVGLAP